MEKAECLLIAILVILALLVVLVYPKMNPQYYKGYGGSWDCTSRDTGERIRYDMRVRPLDDSVPVAAGAPARPAARPAASAPAGAPAAGMTANNGVGSDSENFTITPFQAEAVEEATMYSQASNNLLSSALVGNRVRGYNPDSGDYNGPSWAGPEASVPGSYNDDMLKQCSLDPTIVRNHAEFVKDQKRFNQIAAKPDRGIEGLGNDTGVPVQGIWAMMKYNKERQVVITDPRQVPEVSRDTYLGTGFRFN